MAFTVNQGVRIHYETEGQGFPLVTQHSYTDSMETWYELGYVDALKQTHLVILVDARGHGSSDKPHVTSAYANEKRLRMSSPFMISEFNTPTIGVTRWAVG
jgi:pimeloyl-ACP methyl ester carboxylesterase